MPKKNAMPKTIPPAPDLSAAQGYIDRVLDIQRRHGVAGRVSDAAYQAAVRRVASAFRRLQPSQ